MHKKRKGYIDTGFIVALFHKKDSNHKVAIQVEAELADSCQFISTLFVFQEICWLLKQRVGQDTAINFMELMSTDPIIIFPNLPRNWIERTTTILRKYSDNKLDFADASIVVLADHLGTGEIISTDVKDFNILRWGGNKKKPFNNLFISLQK